MSFDKIKEKVKEKVKKKKTKVSPASTPSTGKAKFEGKYYIWENGKKTHVKFIQLAIQASKPLPIGFYDAAKDSNDKGIQKLLQVDKTRKIPAKVDWLDTRS